MQLPKYLALAPIVLLCCGVLRAASMAMPASKTNVGIIAALKQ
jgi:hypothetical protein